MEHSWFRYKLDSALFYNTLLTLCFYMAEYAIALRRYRSMAPLEHKELD